MNALTPFHQAASTVSWTAALPMYDFPELHGANDALWSAIAERLDRSGITGAPRALTRSQPLEAVWTDPHLLLAQSCGYPFETSLRGRVQLVATPRYRAKGCDGPFHRSAVVVRAGDPASSLADLRGARCAINDWASNSGMNLLRVHAASLAQNGAFFGAVKVSGAHEASARMVGAREADVAAIDCVTWAHLQRLRPEIARQLRVLMWTAQSPGLPLICGQAVDADTLGALRAALADVERDPTLASARADLYLQGFNILPASQYRAVTYLEQIAVSQGYPLLA